MTDQVKESTFMKYVYGIDININSIIGFAKSTHSRAHETMFLDPCHAWLNINQENDQYTIDLNTLYIH